MLHSHIYTKCQLHCHRHPKMSVDWTKLVYLFWQNKTWSTKGENSIQFLVVPVCDTLSAHDISVWFYAELSLRRLLIWSSGSQNWLEHAKRPIHAQASFPQKENGGGGGGTGRAHSLSQLISTSSFSSLHAAWDSKWIKFYTGNKKERWKRMFLPWWLWKVKRLIRSQIEEYTWQMQRRP